MDTILPHFPRYYIYTCANVCERFVSNNIAPLEQYVMGNKETETK